MITIYMQSLFKQLLVMGKNFLFAAISLSLLASSCSPVAYRFNMEKRMPGESGIEFNGKTVSMVYVFPDSFRDSLFAAETSLGFVKSLEGLYYAGSDGVPLFNVADDGKADYSDKDSLVNFVVNTDSDIVFVLHSVSVGEVVRPDDKGLGDNVLATPFKATLSVYDSMYSADTVSSTKISDSFLWQVKDGASMEEIGKSVLSSLADASFEYGRELSATFAPRWKEASYTVILYDSDSRWMEAAEMAVTDMNWKAALDIWMQKADTGNLQKSSCAAYNCALCCYLLGDSKTALKWLDYSDSLYLLSYSKTLRNMIGK